MRNTISEVKYTLEGKKSRLGEAKDQISKLKVHIKTPSQSNKMKKD